MSTRVLQEAPERAWARLTHPGRAQGKGLPTVATLGLTISHTEEPGVSLGGHPAGSLAAEGLCSRDMGTWKSFSNLLKNKTFQRKSSPRADAFPWTLSRHRQGRQTHQTPGRPTPQSACFHKNGSAAAGPEHNTPSTTKTQEYSRRSKHEVRKLFQ